ncbi:MAG: 4-(cytidine 5'-diphospho)-2-C-methyl-D-erythritol kinase [Candidatus Zixiibacteriota bacterium]
MGMKLKTPAKINHFLFVGKEREDGYHEIFTLMSKIGIYDQMKIDLIPGKRLSLFCKGCTGIPKKDNIVYKAWDIACKKLGEKIGVSVNIEKNIPIGSGLAGGSSNAATFLRIVNILLDKPFRESSLEEIALECGSDVPFFIKPGGFLAQGRGEKLMPTDGMPDVKLLIIVPEFGISTKWAYENVKINLTEELQDNIFNSLKRGGLLNGIPLFDNSFRSLLEKEHPEYAQYRKELLDAGALYALPSGSGCAMFGAFENEKDAIAVSKRFENLKTFIVDKVDDMEII